MEVRGVSAVVWAMVLTNYGAASVCCQSMLQGGRGLVNQNMGSSRYKGYYDRFDSSQNSGNGQQAVQGAFPEYSTEALVVSQLSQMDNLMNVIRSIPHPEKMNPAYKAVYSAPAADLLGSLARAQVDLISKRTGPQGEMIDKLLTKIEEKSYQLKTTLIQLHQTEGVTTYFPTTIPTPRYPYYGLQPSLSVYGNPFG